MKLLVLALLLTGCSASDSGEFIEFLFGPSSEKIAAMQYDKCISYGFEENTPHFSNCLLSLETSRKNREAAAARARRVQFDNFGDDLEEQMRRTEDMAQDSLHRFHDHLHIGKR